MTFQLIHRSTRGVKPTPRIAFTLHPKDSTISGPMYAAMGSPSHVQILFDPDGMRIGLRPCTENDPESYILRPQGQGRKDGTPSAGRKIATTGVMSRFDLAEKVRRVYFSVQLLDGIWVVDLTGESVGLQGRRPSTEPMTAPAQPAVAVAPLAPTRQPPPPPTAPPPTQTPAAPDELRLRCNSCDETFEANDRQNFHRHLLREHDRRAEADERAPRPAA